MHYAVELNKERVALFLIAKNSDINARDDKEHTPMHLAAANGLTDMCRFLLDFDANIKFKDWTCWTVLHHAVNGNFYDTVTLLIKRGADINAEDHKFGRTALHLAAEKGYAKIAEMLIIRGANLHSSGDIFYSKTPLHIACLHGYTETVAVLVKKGAQVNLLSGLLDKSPLHLACEEGHVECARILLTNGADINMTGAVTNGSTALHLAAAKDHWHIIELLLQHHANLDLQGKYSTHGTALHIACMEGHIHIVHLLLDAGADREAIDANAHTPLHTACIAGKYDVANMLIELGTNYHAKCLLNKTPVDYVTAPTVKDRMIYLCDRMDRQTQHNLEIEMKRKQREEELIRIKQAEEEKKRQELAEIERQKQLRIDTFHDQLRLICDISGEESVFIPLVQEYYDLDINAVIFSAEGEQATALTRAAERGFYDIVAALLQWHGVNINYQEANGNTALHNAAQHEYRDVLEILLVHNADNGLLNRQGKAAANLVSHNYIREIIRNPRLIHSKHDYQHAVLDEIFRRQRLLSSSAQGTDFSMTVGEAAQDQSLVLFPQSSTISSPSMMMFPPLSPSVPKVGEKKSNMNSNNNGNSSFYNKSGSGEVKLPPIPSSASKYSINNATNTHNNSFYSSSQQKGAGSNSVAAVDLQDSIAMSRYGPIPPAFGGCRADIFLQQEVINGQDEEGEDDYNKQAAMAGGNVFFNDVYSLQRSYLPTSFDTTLEWCEVKDFFWLLAQPYRDYRQDKRSFLYDLAKSMDSIQHTFTHPVEVVVTPTQYRTLSSQDAANLPKNLTTVDVQRLQHFAQHCMDFLVTFLTVYDDTLAGNVKQIMMCYDDSEDGEKNKEIEVLLLLHGEIEYLAQYGYLDPPVRVQLMILLPLCSIHVLPTSQEEDHQHGHEEKGFEQGHNEDEEEEERFKDPLQGLWSPLVINPPRARRVAVDAIYDLAVFVMDMAQSTYATDAVRAHLWGHQGRLLLQRRKEEAIRLHDAEQLALEEGHIGRAAQRLWLKEMHLLEYDKYFVGAGFKVLQDFQELNEQDCYTFFPFVKIGDMRRLTKSCMLLTDDLIAEYERKIERRLRDREKK